MSQPLGYVSLENPNAHFGTESESRRIECWVFWFDHKVSGIDCDLTDVKMLMMLFLVVKKALVGHGVDIYRKTKNSALDTLNPLTKRCKGLGDSVYYNFGHLGKTNKKDSGCF